MAYNKTVWVNGTTPVHEGNMNKIEEELFKLSGGGEALDTLNDTTLDTGYYLANGTTTNAPFASAWLVQVVNRINDDVIIQIAYRYRNDTMDGTIFIRQHNTLGTTGWKDWKKVLTNDDTGWITATVTSAFKGYGNNNNNLPKYRKVNNYVEIRGIVSPTSDIAADGTANIFTLPEGYRPDYDRAFICQGSGINRWLLTVQSNGVVMFSRYGASASAKAPTGAWLPISVGFLVG